MKHEKIYEIPVNDAFNTDCECPLCVLESNLEKKNIEYTLGPAMMKPDFRIETNKNGFCRRHLGLMLSETNKLPLALVLDTHLNEVCGILDKKTGIKKTPDTDSIIKELTRLESSCVICTNMNTVLKKYIDVIFYMWLTDEAFRQKFLSSKGFCLKHFLMLLNEAKKELKKKDAAEFCELISDLEKKELQRVNEDINWFTKKFDYKNQDADWKNSKDAPPRSAAKLWGYIEP